MQKLLSEVFSRAAELLAGEGGNNEQNEERIENWHQSSTHGHRNSRTRPNPIGNDRGTNLHKAKIYPFLEAAKRGCW